MLLRRLPVALLVFLISSAWVPQAQSVERVRSCDGVRVREGANLRRVMSRHGPRTTYCLDAGMFEITRPIETDVGDRIIGAGRNATFINGSGLPATAEGIFLAATNAYFAHLDVFGAPTPSKTSGTTCSPSSNCGKAFSLRGTSLTLRSIDCHHNGGNCIGGGGEADVTVDDLNCWRNGNAYSMTRSFLYAACIKRAAVYSNPGSTTVTNSFIHDNRWVGIWCDHCKNGLFVVENNRFVRNGLTGIEWEMSGGWTSSDQAIIKGNVFKRNNYLRRSFAGGMHVSTANDIIISGNRFRGNQVAGVNIIFAASRNPPQPDSRGVVVRNNTMNGDDVRGCSLESVTCRDNN